MESIVNYMEPRDIYDKIGTNASELSEAEHGFICGLIKKYKPKKIVELGVSGGGTSVLVLNCLQKLGLNDTKMYSVDLSETYHFNPDKKCGFQIDEAKPYLKNIDNHKLILGKILPEVIEDIAKDGKIDFIILDTTHYLPGELMDFAIAIPFLADNAVVVLDDTSFWFEGENRWAFATKVLFDLCISPNKYYAETPDGFSKIVGFTMPEKTSLWQKNIFDALSMPWHYFADSQTGVSLEDAYDYSTLGCVEITIGGREFSNTEEARINWLKILELLLFNGKCALTGKEWHLKENHVVEELTTFDELYEWFKEELKSTISRVGEYIDMASVIYSQHWPVPFLSSITIGCIENASDITENGTKYYNLSINCVGMANTVDALEAVEELVYIKKTTTIEEIKKALVANFEGYEWLRQEMLQCPKYGNDIDHVDNKMKDLMELFSSHVHNMHIVNRNGKFQCGFYSVMHHTLLGMKTAASCDGRYARTSLSNSLSPVQGMDKNGPTSVMNSINKISMDYMGNGGVLDMKFTPQFLEKQNHLIALRYLIETYFDEGGLEVQFNVVSKDTLIKAQKEPEKYGSLVVRVSGYSAYFVKLDKELQDEIIMRTENKVV